MSRGLKYLSGTVCACGAVLMGALSRLVLTDVAVYMAHEPPPDLTPIHIIAIPVMATCGLVALVLMVAFLWLFVLLLRSAITGCALPEVLVGPAQDSDRG